MVRNYDPSRPVPAEVLTRLLEYAIRAPSAGFSQGWGFLVLTGEADRQRFWDATSDPAERSPWFEGMSRAPAIVVPHSSKDVYLDRYAAPDTGFASLLMLLTAVDEGLGACFFGIPPERTADYRAEFGVPEEFTPIGAVSVGYPAADLRSGSLARGHRPVDEVVHRGHWTQ